MNGDIDLTLVRTFLVSADELNFGRVFDPPEDMRTMRLRRERLVAVLGEDHRLAGRASVHLAELDDEQFMFWPREQAPLYYDRLVSICNQGNCRPRGYAADPW